MAIITNIDPCSPGPPLATSAMYGAGVHHFGGDKAVDAVKLTLTKTKNLVLGFDWENCRKPLGYIF